MSFVSRYTIPLPLPPSSQEGTGEPEGDEIVARHVPLGPKGTERQSSANGS